MNGELVHATETFDRVVAFGKLIATEDLSWKDHHVQELVDNALRFLNGVVG